MKIMKETVIQSIVAWFIGHKYYANIINTRGTDNAEISCFIFHTREEAEDHRRTIENTRSFLYIETISFRSRKVY